MHLKKYPVKIVDHETVNKISYSNIYNFYYKWRINRKEGSYNLFEANIHRLKQNFIQSYNISMDNLIPFKIQEKPHKNIINGYLQEISRVKKFGSEFSHNIDAKNVYLIEQKRNYNNYSFIDTKYYMISADQKLREWDYERTDKQPIILLPSQWMSLMLKFMSRSENDFKSFTNFIKLNKGNSTISSKKLHTILHAINEVTEDLNNQKGILNNYMDGEFKKLTHKNIPDKEIIEQVSEFSRKYLDEKFEKLNADMHQFKTNLEDEKKEINLQNKRDNALSEKQNFEQLIIDKQKELSRITIEKESLQRRRSRSERRFEQKTKNYSFRIGVPLFLIIIVFIFFVLTCPKLWEVTDKIMTVIGIPIALIIAAKYFANGTKLDITYHINKIRDNWKKEIEDEYDFSQKNLDKYVNDEKQLSESIELLEIKIIDLNNQFNFK